MARQPKLGTGQRFKRCVQRVSRRADVDDPRALCAAIGRRKYGPVKFAQLAAAGRRNPERGDWILKRDQETVGVYPGKQFKELAPMGPIAQAFADNFGAQIVLTRQGDSHTYGVFEPAAATNPSDWQAGRDAALSGASYKEALRAHVVQAEREAGHKLSANELRMLQQRFRKSYQDHRRNPADSARLAAELSEAFHGRRVESVTEYTETLEEPEDLADLGELVEIVIHRPRVTLKEFDGTRLAGAPADTSGDPNLLSTDLYLVGGDQTVDPDAVGIEDRTKRFWYLGKVRTITYATDKQHLGPEDKRHGPYIHLLGEEGGEMARLVYDKLNRRLLPLIGGSYRIERDMPGGRSAGIRN